MTSNKDLVNSLINGGVLKTKNVIEAFLGVDRKDFVKEEDKNLAYEDVPLSIGFGQTISQPSTLAFMLELLNVRPGSMVLDVGSGSGYTTTLLSSLAGYVYGSELTLDLVKFGQENLSKYNPKNALILPAKIDELGLKKEGPFERILVSASADKFPKDLLDQLTIGGVCVIPVGHSIFRVTRVAEDKFNKEEYPGFVFVPLR